MKFSLRAALVLLTVLVLPLSMSAGPVTIAGASDQAQTAPKPIATDSSQAERQDTELSPRGDRSQAAMYTTQPAPSQFVGTAGSDFMLDGQIFRFGGANAYYIAYDSQNTVNDALQRAAAMNLKVVRTFGFHDHGSPDGSVPNTDVGGWNDIYFQYWDPVAGKPAYNDGPGGLQKLDYAIDRAGKMGLKLIVILTDNWKHLGGMDQYVTWYGLKYHDDFYTDSRCKQAYKDYVKHLLNRVNSISGVKYKDDPTIMAWELASEPRPYGDGSVPDSGNRNPQIITDWVREMSAYVKSIDPNHLVAVGDEGLLNRAGATDWMYNGSQGVDSESFINLPTVDFGVFHLYPELWEKPISWADKWIADHAKIADTTGKPVIMEEFGVMDKEIRSDVFNKWTDQLLTAGASGFAFWNLGAIYSSGKPWPDDGFMVYYPMDATSSVVAQAAERFAKSTMGNTSPEPLPTPVPGMRSDVYRNALKGWSLDSTTGIVNLAATAFVHSGNASLAYTDTAGAQGAVIVPNTGTFDARQYTNLRFYINGGKAAGQSVGISLAQGGQWGPVLPLEKYIQGGRIVAGAWRLVDIPVADLAAQNSDITGINIKYLSGGTSKVFIDDIRFMTPVE